MGSFDTVRCQFLLPRDANRLEFQTKDLNGT